MEPIQINIHTNTEIFLKEGKYHINIVGGWKIEFNGFSIELEHLDRPLVVIANRSFWPVQFFWRGRRAKRIFTFEIKEKGNYGLRFINSINLEVRHSNLRTLMHRIFTEPVKNKNLSVVIKPKGY